MFEQGNDSIIDQYSGNLLTDNMFESHYEEDYGVPFENKLC